MKTSSLGLAALLVVGGLSVPAFASDSSFDDDFIVTQLQQRGVAAIAAYENSDNVIRAEVKLADGKTAFQYFYEDTLQPVKAPGSQTRVMTQVDSGARTAPVSKDSLLVDNFFD